MANSLHRVLGPQAYEHLVYVEHVILFQRKGKGKQNRKAYQHLTLCEDHFFVLDKDMMAAGSKRPRPAPLTDIASIETKPMSEDFLEEELRKNSTHIIVHLREDEGAVCADGAKCTGKKHYRAVLAPSQQQDRHSPTLDFCTFQPRSQVAFYLRRCWISAHVDTRMRTGPPQLEAKPRASLQAAVHAVGIAGAAMRDRANESAAPQVAPTPTTGGKQVREPATATLFN